jgi:hypothetical protein
MFMSLIRNFVVMLAFVAQLAGCSNGKGLAPQQLQVTTETLIGRWSAMPKDLAAKNPGGSDVRGAAGEVIKQRWEFKADQSFEMAVDANFGSMAELALKNKVVGTWRALTLRGNTLTLELSRPAGGQQETAQTTIVFESTDKCTYDAGDGELIVLSRIP